MNGALNPSPVHRMIPLPGLAGALSTGSLLLAASNGGDTGSFTIQSVTALVTALSGLLVAIAAWRRGGGGRDDDEDRALTRAERAELARLRRERRRRRGSG